MMSEKELIERDKNRDLGTELLESVRQMKAGQKAAQHQVEVSEVSAARQNIGLSQTEFAELMGVSKRTLQEWEQGRKKPSGAANSLLRIAIKRPDVLREVFGDAA